MPIEFYLNAENKEGEFHKATNFLTPVTLFGLEKEVESTKELNKFLNNLAECNSKASLTPSFECLYDNEFDEAKYTVLCSYDFNLFVINVSPKYLEKARPFIEADKDKEDVLIVNIETPLIK